MKASEIYKPSKYCSNYKLVQKIGEVLVLLRSAINKCEQRSDIPIKIGKDNTDLFSHYFFLTNFDISIKAMKFHENRR